MTDLIGQQLGNYRLIRLLGTGGYAEVYLGEHIHLKRQTAIKVLHTILKDEQKEDFLIEAQRLKERVEYDLEMIRELGYCNGIENYSRFFDRRKPGSRPFCLLDYFPPDFLCVIDESHQTIPQVSGMYGGDRSRKTRSTGRPSRRSTRSSSPTSGTGTT